jgi:hypothetical protein
VKENEAKEEEEKVEREVIDPVPEPTRFMKDEDVPYYLLRQMMLPYFSNAERGPPADPMADYIDPVVSPERWFGARNAPSAEARLFDAMCQQIGIYADRYMTDIGLAHGDFDAFQTKCTSSIEDYLLESFAVENHLLEENNGDPSKLSLACDEERDSSVASVADDRPEEMSLTQLDALKVQTFVGLEHPYYFTLLAYSVLGVLSFDQVVSELFFQRLYTPNEKTNEDGQDEKAVTRNWTTMMSSGFLHIKIEDHDPFVTSLHELVVGLVTEKSQATFSSPPPPEEGNEQKEQPPNDDPFSVVSTEDLLKKRTVWLESNSWARRMIEYVANLKAQLKELEAKSKKILTKDQHRYVTDLVLSKPKLDTFGDVFYYWLLSFVTEDLFCSLRH